MKKLNSFSKFSGMALMALAIATTACQTENVAPKLMPKAASVSSDVQSPLQLYFSNGTSFVTSTLYNQNVEVLWGQDRTVQYPNAYPAAYDVTVTLYKPAERVPGPTRDQTIIIPAKTYTIQNVNPYYYSSTPPRVPTGFYNNGFTLDLVSAGVEEGTYRVTVQATSTTTSLIAAVPNTQEPYLKAIGSLTVYY